MARAHPITDEQRDVVPWESVLHPEERGVRIYNASRILRFTENITHEAIAKDMKMSRPNVSKNINNPSIMFALKFDYLYGVDILEVYPELGFLRDRWMEEFQDHLELIKAAADLKNPEMIKELVEACEHGVALYSSPELVQEMKRLRGEAVVNAVKAGVQDARRDRLETYQEARARRYAKAVNSKTTD